MFSVYCPRHGSEVLLWDQCIEEIRNTTAGVELHWRCPCGARGTTVTGQVRQQVA